MHVPEGRPDEVDGGRTTGQLRLFAESIRRGNYFDRRHDPTLPDTQPLPRLDLRIVPRRTGPVAVFGACNFPLAAPTAGGDTAAAMARVGTPSGTFFLIRGTSGGLVQRPLVQAVGFPGLQTHFVWVSQRLGRSRVTGIAVSNICSDRKLNNGAGRFSALSVTWRS
jgi:NADP-dependent aldehyde dehydrogenase